ncbi:MAG: hypothetical protein HY226_03610 [Candidatus Vogelbacteria bacterium]|nr:hypothetical protein [Candidatus Vogelbacteria bacterium]
MPEWILAGLAAIFVLNSPACLLFLLGIVLLVIYEVDKENGDWAAGILFVTALAFAKWSDFNVFALIWAHPFYSLLGFVAYLLFGTFVYTPFIKWPLYVIDRLHDHIDLKNRFLLEHNIYDNAVPLELRGEYVKFLGRNGVDLKNLEPKIARHWRHFVRWSTLWPFSGFWTLLRDPINKLCRVAYEYLRAGMDRRARRIFAGQYSDLETTNATTPAPTPPTPVAEVAAPKGK